MPHPSASHDRSSAVRHTSGLIILYRCSYTLPDLDISHFFYFTCTIHCTISLAGYCQTKLNRRLRVGVGRLLSYIIIISFLCIVNMINWPSSTDAMYAIGRLPSLPGRRGVKPANSARGRSQLGDWLPHKCIGSQQKCIALLQSLLQGELNAPSERAVVIRCLNQK